ncbi:putative paramyosin-like [Cocos nucifera]|nr:putative paramyosin-like [Cocos nucifera]
MYKTDAKMLKIMKDKALKEAGEASTRVDAIERRAEDAETMLRRSAKENYQLLDAKEALVAKVVELKARSAKVRELEAKIVEIKTILKVAEEKVANLQSELEV